MTDKANDSTAKAATEEPEGKDLNSLLADWDEPKKAVKEESSEIEALKAKVASLSEAEGIRSYKAEMENVVIPKIKGDLDVDNDLVEFWVNKQADDDSRLQKLWENRSDNKKAFNDAIDALAPEFKKYAESKNLISKKANNALAAAVKTARTSDSKSSSLKDVDFGSLSDNEFALKKAEVFRLAKANQL